MAIKLIALDLDNTTLNSAGKLSPGNRQALEEAIDRNVNVVIATGRCKGALPEEVTDIKGVQYAITSNGAQIVDLRSGKAIYSNCIAPDSVVAAEKILHKYEYMDYMVEVFVDGVAYMERQVYEDVKSGRDSHRHRDYVVNTRNPKENLLGFLLDNRNEIENINIFFATMEDKDKLYPVLQTIPNVTLTTSLDSNWEIGGATTSKASALKELARELNVKKSEIMACGDSPNDGDMLRASGVPVAVGNAKPVIKEIASFISGTNDEDGVATAVRKYVL
ncbi:MAG: Cof-type HAD-IIB family hydrolase [Anaerovoracaceae bacterium]|jgi:Cof subfamily protein (haloacid dehalogenase superfamily)